MRVRLITISQKSPAWIQIGFDEYAKRITSPFSLELLELPAEKRTSKLTIDRAIEKEGERMLAAIKPNHLIVALDVQGKHWSSEEFAHQLSIWQSQGQSMDLLIGGADGLAPSCLNAATIKWSLSRLTFPHLLVRLMVAEQLYRAYTILYHHPYHR